MSEEFITEQGDPRLSDLWQPDDPAGHSDLLHISLCCALFELALLRTESATLREELGRYMMSGNTMSHRIVILKRAADIAEGILNINGIVPEQFTTKLEEFRAALAALKEKEGKI